MTSGLVKILAQEMRINEANTLNAIKLLFEENCTIPFVTRYRKEKTGSMDEVQLRTLRDRFVYLKELEATKERYLKVVEEHCQTKPELVGKFPELKRKFMECQTKQELEDLYLPFKPKRRTRATMAKEKGLEPLLHEIMANLAETEDLIALARPYVTPPGSTLDKALHVMNEEAALSGAADIFAEQINENALLRALVRQISFDTGVLVAQKSEGSAVANKDKATLLKYENYFDYREPISKTVSHRVMAVRRGEAEKILRVSIEVDAERVQRELFTKVKEEKGSLTGTCEAWLRAAVEDAYKRLMSPSIETEIRLFLKGQAEDEAIRVFTTNLEKLLLLPPVPNRSVLGIDPGIRTGSKLAVISETGKMLAYKVIYPMGEDDQSQQNKQAKETLKELLVKHNVECVAIGNGTGSREIDRLVIAVIKESNLKQIKRIVVNEAGASVYSTDDIARDEFPDLDPTIRSAISIARRLQDPLAELVKIDPRSLGVGQYQHDCDVNKLNGSLKETVESCVNRVGVNLNTASFKLLSYVSGIGPSLAKGIVETRDKNGAFHNRQDLTKVPGLGPKTFEQAAGFLRIPDSSNPLDNSAVHPERYAIVERIANDLHMPVADLIGKKAVVDAISFERYVDEEVGMPTLLDIAKELVKPGRDPREDGERLLFSDEVSSIDDLKVGMKLKGTVSNVTRFGAFVDIGVHQDGLVHISELSAKFVNDPSAQVAVGDIVDVVILDVDRERKRISLSCKDFGKQPKQSHNDHRQPSQQTHSARPRPTNGQGQTDQRRSNGTPRPFVPKPREGQQPDNRRFEERQKPRDPAPAFRGHDNRDRPRHDKNRPPLPRQGRKEPVKHFSLDDLVNKFNNRG